MSRRHYGLVLAALVWLALLPACSLLEPVQPPLPVPPPTPSPAPAPPLPTPPSPAPPKPASPAGNPAVTRDVVYGKGGDIPLLLDIYTPARPLSSPVPAIVWIHGGGWRGGDKFPSQVQTMVRRGFFGISINYRLSNVASFPAAVEDSKTAIRWLRANASKYGVDPDRIGVWGGSAGGHLSLIVATADSTAGLEGAGGWPEYSSRVQAAVSYFGPSDFVTLGSNQDPRSGGMRDDAGIQFLGGAYEKVPDVYRLASPVTHVTADDPPLLLVHGDRDTTVPFNQSQIMYDAYRKLGLEATLIKVTGAGHGFQQPPPPAPRISPSPAEIDQTVAAFFLKHLAKK